MNGIRAQHCPRHGLQAILERLWCYAQALLALKRTDAYRRSGRTYRNAMAYLLASNPDTYLANVFLESELCISCFYEVGVSLLTPDILRISHNCREWCCMVWADNKSCSPACMCCSDQLAVTMPSILCTTVCQGGAIAAPPIHAMSWRSAVAGSRFGGAHHVHHALHRRPALQRLQSRQ